MMSMRTLRSPGVAAYLMAFSKTLLRMRSSSTGLPCQLRPCSTRLNTDSRPAARSRLYRRRNCENTSLMSTTSTVRSSGLANSTNWWTMESMRSISSIIEAWAASGRALISTSRRSRVSGVRTSCETPASTMARSASMACSSPASSLKRRLSMAISGGPVSGRRGGGSPRDRRSMERARLASGRLTSRLMSSPPMVASRMPMAEAAISVQLLPVGASRRSGSAISQ